MAFGAKLFKEVVVFLGGKFAYISAIRLCAKPGKTIVIQLEVVSSAYFKHCDVWQFPNHATKRKKWALPWSVCQLPTKASRFLRSIYSHLNGKRGYRCHVMPFGIVWNFSKNRDWPQSKTKSSSFAQLWVTVEGVHHGHSLSPRLVLQSVPRVRLKVYVYQPVGFTNLLVTSELYLL